MKLKWWAGLGAGSKEPSKHHFSPRQPAPTCLYLDGFMPPATARVIRLRAPSSCWMK